MSTNYNKTGNNFGSLDSNDLLRTILLFFLLQPKIDRSRKSGLRPKKILAPRWSRHDRLRESAGTVPGLVGKAPFEGRSPRPRPMLFCII